MTATNFSGFKIKGLRAKKSMNLADTAKQLDITTSYLSLIENGKKIPSKKVIEKAARLFDVSIESFSENPLLLDELKSITKDAELSDLIQAFEIILREKS